jgi:hypothetical protein
MFSSMQNFSQALWPGKSEEEKVYDLSWGRTP